MNGPSAAEALLSFALPSSNAERPSKSRRLTSLPSVAPTASPALSMISATSGRSEERRVGKECVVRVDLGGRRIIKKKNKTITKLKYHVIQRIKRQNQPILIIHSNYQPKIQSKL